MWEKTSLFFTTVFFKGIALFPYSVLYVLSDGLYYILYYLVKYRRKVVHENLIHSFPERTNDEIKTIEKKFYHQLCDYMVETIKLLHVSDEQIRERLRFTNSELIEEIRTDKRPIFIYLGHFGNWEYITSITTWIDKSITACQVYHPLSNKTMDTFFLKLRSRFHSESIPLKRTLRVILGMLQKGEQPLLGLIADQRPTWAQSTTWMRFLNQKTAIITGGETMGHRLNAHFIYGSVTPTSRGHYEITLIPMQPIEGEEFSITKQYMKMLEKDILKHPSYWLWSHKRWKYKFEDRFPNQEFTE